MRRSPTTTAVLLLALSPLVALLGRITPALGKDAQVAIVSIVQGYRPGTVTVASGDTVTWTNQDADQLHNAICDASCPETFSSGPSAPKGSVGSHRFVKEGTYRYHCELHPNMVGFVVVTAPAATTTTAAGGTTTTSSPHATTSSSTTSTTALAVLTTEPTTTTVVPAIVPAPPMPESNDKNDSRKLALVVAGVLLVTALASFVATRVSDRRRV